MVLTKNFVVPDHLDALAFAEELDGMTDAQDVVLSMQRAARNVGADMTLFAELPDQSGQPAGLLFVDDGRPEWVEHYISSGYIDADPVVRKLRRSSLPFRYDSLKYDPADRLANAVMAARRDFGMHDGLAVPVRHRRGLACFALVGERLDLPPRSALVFTWMAFYSFEAIKNLVRPLSLRDRRSLTEREREVLKWVAVGKTAWEIGEILGIAKRTVDEHAQAAIRKLEAANRTHAVAIAVRERVITI